MAALTF
jgi:putative transposase